MTYIGSNPISQYYQEGIETFAVGTAPPQSIFNLSRPAQSIASIQVFTGSTQLTPNTSNYQVNGNQLVLVSGVTNTTVTVRYLTSSSYSVSPPVGTININAINASGVPSANNFLRGDGRWALPNIPQNVKTAAYVLAATDAGYHISITTGGVTVPPSVFGIGDAVTIFNNSGIDQIITSGTGVTLYLAGTTTTGNRTLASYGIATLLCVAGNTFVISGQGLS